MNDIKLPITKCMLMPWLLPRGDVTRIVYQTMSLDAPCALLNTGLAHLANFGCT